MLSKNTRISRAEFPKIIKFGTRYSSHSFVLCVLKQNKPKINQNKTKEEDFPSKFSFSVSKKILKNATDRNKYRRRGYSIISKYQKQTKNNFLCLFSFKKTNTQTPFSRLESEITSLLKESGVLI